MRQHGGKNKRQDERPESAAVAHLALVGDGGGGSGLGGDGVGGKGGSNGQRRGAGGHMGMGGGGGMDGGGHSGGGGDSGGRHGGGGGGGGRSGDKLCNGHLKKAVVIMYDDDETEEGAVEEITAGEADEWAEGAEGGADGGVEEGVEEEADEAEEGEWAAVSEAGSQHNICHVIPRIVYQRFGNTCHYFRR